MRFSALSFAIFLLAWSSPGESTEIDWMPRVEDRTQMWWEEGPPRIFNGGASPAEQTLVFEYGGRTLRFDARRVRPAEGEWECALVLEGRRYVCTGRRDVGKDDFRQPVRFVEAGRFFQRVVIENLRFADADGHDYEGTVRLEISVWPDRCAFRLENEGEAALELRWDDLRANGVKSAQVVRDAGAAMASVNSELVTSTDAALGCVRLALPEEAWSNRERTFYPVEHLDRVDGWRVTLRNDSDEPTVARLMFTQEKNLPITGFTPMLCDADGTPTGLPVQISKNWHRHPEKGSLLHEGPWFHGFAFVRVPPKSERELRMQMVYARYGGVCAASHAQLCLIGWGHNQFWDQAAIGSFGESICFEPGRVQRRCFITDVRPLMTLPHGEKTKPYSWAENAGGADFLMWQDHDGRYRRLIGTRTDYRAYGPCLTDVGYREESDGGEIVTQMDVSIPAANDHLRTCVRLRYEVKKPMRWKRLAFLQLGADFYNEVPARKVAIGTVAGLTEEWEPRRAKDEYDRVAIPLAGGGAWVSVHGVERSALTKGKAAATRGLIVRSWRAMLGGKPAGPQLSFFCTEWGKNNHRTAVELAPPAEVTELLPGDFIEADVELVVFPADADAYYGPDENLRAALEQGGDTWRPVQREAAGNTLRVSATRGEVRRSYPTLIAVDAEQNAAVRIEGGLGHVPVTFTGLSKPRGYRLRVNGVPMEHWQTDWLPGTGRWQMTCNVPTSDTGRIDLEFSRTE